MKLTQIKPAEVKLLDSRKYAMDELPKIICGRSADLKPPENR